MRKRWQSCSFSNRQREPLREPKSPGSQAIGAVLWSGLQALRFNGMVPGLPAKTPSKGEPTAPSLAACSTGQQLALCSPEVLLDVYPDPPSLVLVLLGQPRATAFLLDYHLQRLGKYYSPFFCTLNTLHLETSSQPPDCLGSLRFAILLFKWGCPKLERVH